MIPLTLESVMETFAIMFNAKTFFFFACLNIFFRLNTGIREPLPQQPAQMTDEELICNLVKRLSFSVFGLVGNFPSVEQKHCEVAGF